ncbi:MAG: DUF3179 domain-containing (seleno)protein, partial [Chloroflexi bacterium]|nr:DUF3179 domain-containing (seleno)protein [Chloroflexota bacterium]
VLAGCVLIAASAAGCVAAAPDTLAPAATPTLEPVFRPGSPGTTATPAPTVPAALDDAAVTALLRSVVCWYERPADAPGCVPPGPDTVSAIETMALSGDARLIAPLVDMLALDVGWGRYAREGLERLTGEARTDAHAWYAWLAEEHPPLPVEYATWKGRLLSLIDRRFAEILSERLGDAIPADELIWSGVPVNGLPPLNSPATVHRVEQRYLDDGDIVFGLYLEDEPRAYPERILGWHELVQEEVDGRDIVIAYCGPCGSAAAYSAIASDGRTYSFGTSGLVYRSRRLLFDERTFSLWDPVSGVAIAGPLASAGVRLEPLPLLRTTWSDWSTRRPGTQVLALDTGTLRDYGEGVAIREVVAAGAPLYPAGTLDDRLAVKARVLGVEIGGETRAYALDAVERSRIVHDRLGGQDIVLISVGPGRGVVVYDESDVRFVSVGGDLDALEITDGDGVRWFADERRLVNARNGRVRDAIASRTAYWFAWSGAYPQTRVWSE